MPIRPTSRAALDREILEEYENAVEIALAVTPARWHRMARALFHAGWLAASRVLLARSRRNEDACRTAVQIRGEKITATTRVAGLIAESREASWEHEPGDDEDEAEETDEVERTDGRGQEAG